MVEHEGGQWNLATTEHAVYLERVSEDSEHLFDDSLAPEEARQLARLLTKHADKISDSGGAAKADEEDDETVTRRAVSRTVPPRRQLPTTVRDGSGPTHSTARAGC